MREGNITKNHLPSTGGGTPLPNHSLATAWRKIEFNHLWMIWTKHLVSVLATDGSASHPVTAVNRCLVIVDHDAATHNRSVPTEGQVGVGEEGLGAGKVPHPAGHTKVGVLVLQVANLAASLAFFSGTKVDPRTKDIKLGHKVLWMKGLMGNRCR